MKLLFLGLFLISSSLFAQEETLIEADYRCEKKGGGIAFKTGPNARIWATDKGASMGAELEKISSFTTGGCPGCYKFTGIIIDKIKVRGTVVDFKLTYEMYNKEEKKWFTFLKDTKCVPVKH